MDSSSPDSFVHGISQARILEGVAISFSRGSSQLRDQIHVFCTGKQILYHRATYIFLAQLKKTKQTIDLYNISFSYRWLISRPNFFPHKYLAKNFVEVNRNLFFFFFLYKTLLWCKHFQNQYIWKVESDDLQWTLFFFRIIIFVLTFFVLIAMREGEAYGVKHLQVSKSENSYALRSQQIYRH